MTEAEVIDTLRKVRLMGEEGAVSATCSLCGGRLRRQGVNGTLGEFVEAMLQHFAGNHRVSVPLEGLDE